MIEIGSIVLHVKHFDKSYFPSSFISSMLTAVLTYHLAWIPTVTPAGAVPSRTYLDKHTAKWVCTRSALLIRVSVYLSKDIVTFLSQMLSKLLEFSAGHLGKIPSLQPSLGSTWVSDMVYVLTDYLFGFCI